MLPKSLLIFLFLIPSMCMANELCELDGKGGMTVEVDDKVIHVGVSHKPMSKAVVSVPIRLQGMSLIGMEVTQGEVAEFFIPLAYDIKDNFAVAEIVGYVESLKKFEIVRNYEGGECYASMQTMLINTKNIFN